MRSVEVTAFVLFAGSLLLIFVLIARRAFLARQARRHAALLKRLRSAATAFVNADAPEPAPELGGEEAQAFAEILGGYAQRLSGTARERIAAYFEASGGVEAELRLLRSGRAWRRATAAFTLGDMGSPRAVPDLLRALGDRRRDVRMAATRSLGRLGAVEAIEPVIVAALAGRIPRDVAGLALLDLGPTAVPRLLELTQDDDPRVRAAALELVGLLGDAADARSVLDRLRDPAAAVRAAGAEALGRLGAGQARDALVGALEDRIPAVRAAAARALGRTGGSRAVEALLSVARADEFEPARAAAETLARIDRQLVLRTASEPDAGPHLREAADLVAL